MRIAQVAPLFESVPPKLYGGTERVVAYLTEELVRQGHEVTLFASGDSTTSANLRAITPRALRLGACTADPTMHHILMVEQVLKELHDFDIIHFHIDYLHFALSRHLKLTQLTTLHGRLDLPEIQPIYREYHEMPVVSISEAQRYPLPRVNWQATVHNGIPVELMQFQPKKGEYLAFIGRISPEKGTHTAIEIALRSGMPLKIAAKVDKVDQDYFSASVQPLLNHTGIEYVGEINDQEKSAFLGGAYALLFPIAWPEPFGLAVIESMACGTPVIAFNRGSVPELIKDGENGFIVDSVEQAVAAVLRIPQIQRRQCRDYFNAHFSSKRMAHDYLDVYEKICQNGAVLPRRPIRVNAHG